MLRATVVTVALAAALSGCGGIGQPKPYDSPGINGLEIPASSLDPDDFVDVVDNPWLALEPGTSWRMDVAFGGQAREAVFDFYVGDETVDVDGIEATPVALETDMGNFQPLTLLYAQDVDGNVWIVGARGYEYEPWTAGENGAEAGLAMPADPRLGDGWLAYAVPGRADATMAVEEVTADMVRLRDETTINADAVYEKGVGLVSLVGLDHTEYDWTAIRR